MPVVGTTTMLDTAIAPDETSSAKVSPLCRPRFRRSTTKSETIARRGNSVPKSLNCSVDPAAAAAAGENAAADGMKRGLQPMASSDQLRRASAGSDISPSAALEPRIRQYEKNELLQDRSPETGLTELESFLLEKQQQMDDDEDQSTGPIEVCVGLVPRAPFYQPHPLLQVRGDIGMTELEMYLMEKDASLTLDAAAAAVDQVTTTECDIKRD